MNKIDKIVSENKFVILYISNNSCSVCKVLKPKIKKMIQSTFPTINFFEIDINKERSVTSQLSIFSIPTLILYANGKEFLRESRNISLSILEEQINRIYNLLL